jgi:hypothetical protein
MNSKSIVVPILKGGLGNQLFIIASSFSFAQKNGFDMWLSNEYIEYENIYKHSNVNYYENIFSKLVDNKITNIQRYKSNLKQINRENFHIQLSENYKMNTLILLDDYFQDYRLFENYHDIICKSIILPCKENFHIEFENVCFIHFRKTDFKHTLHNVLTLDTVYYQNCIQHVLLLYPEATFLVISDDIELVKQEYHDFFSCQDLDFKYLTNYNEIDTLAIMKYCSLGGITANSTFSWWGLYLDTSRPILMIPMTYFNDHDSNHNGYYFPSAIIKNI